jgi:hypothetical protein
MRAIEDLSKTSCTGVRSVPPGGDTEGGSAARKTVYVNSTGSDVYGGRSSAYEMALTVVFPSAEMTKGSLYGKEACRSGVDPSRV